MRRRRRRGRNETAVSKLCSHTSQNIMKILLLFHSNCAECWINVSNVNEKDRCTFRVAILSGYVMIRLEPPSTTGLFSTLQSEKTKQLFLS